MNIIDINLVNYNLTVLAYSQYNDLNVIPANQFEMKFGAGAGLGDMEQLIKDMVVMNAVRGNSSPAVKEAYEQLLTVLALTK